MNATFTISSALIDARSKNNQIRITWDNHRSIEYHSIWLRDNCRCQFCGEPAIGRRRLHLTTIDLSIQPIEVKVVDTELFIDWSDGHKSSYSSQWLLENAYDENSRRTRSFKPRHWDKVFRSHPPTFEFNAVSSCDKPFLAALEKLLDHGLCIIRNAPACAGTLKQFALKLGAPQTSNFGCIQNLVFDRSKASIAQ